MTTEENKAYARRLRDAIETVIGTNNTVTTLATAAVETGELHQIETAERQIKKIEKKAQERIWQIVYKGAGRDIGT